MKKTCTALHRVPFAGQRDLKFRDSQPVLSSDLVIRKGPNVCESSGMNFIVLNLFICIFCVFPTLK